MCFKKKPDLSNLTFLEVHSKRLKFYQKIKHIFLGYSENIYCYRNYDSDTDDGSIKLLETFKNQEGSNDVGDTSTRLNKDNCLLENDSFEDTSENTDNTVKEEEVNLRKSDRKREEVLL